MRQTFAKSPNGNGPHEKCFGLTKELTDKWEPATEDRFYSVVLTC